MENCFCCISSLMNQAAVFLFLIIFSACNNTASYRYAIESNNAIALTENKIADVVTNAKSFAKRKRFNQEYLFLIDMSLSSGKKRFFVYHSKSDSVLFSGLVAHGSCNTRGLTKAKYSNQKNSGCSSLGKYKVGIKYSGRFGLAYKLHGLDSSNHNAFERAIVLHSYDCIPDYEMLTEAPICNSLGCPMVSPKFLQQLQPIIDGSKQSILLWIYE